MMFGKEMSLIDEETGDCRLLVQHLHFGEDVSAFVKSQGIRGKADARGNLANTRPVIKGSRKIRVRMPRS